MKPKKKALTWSAASATRLYLDELDEIQAALLKVCDEVAIEHPDFEEISAPKDLKGIEGPIRQLTFRAHKGYGAEQEEDSVRVLFAPDSVRVIAAEDRPELRGIVDELKHIIWKGEWFGSKFLPLLTGMGVNGAILWALILAENREWINILAVLAVGSGFVWATVKAHGRIFTTIVPSYRAGSPSFWKRNRDALIVQGLTALIGTGLGALVTWLILE